jgi:hemerythrin superfamily protein
MPNATQLLRQDHKKVDGLFKKFEQAKGSEAKRRIAQQAMNELEIHAKVEEEIFYPAVKNEAGEEELVQEAKEEHQTVKELIRELKQMPGEDEEFQEKFSELMENVKHHVQEEEGQMFPKVEDSEMDLAETGEQMSERKHELMGQMGANGRGSRSRGQSKSKQSKSGRARRSSTSKRARAR